MCMGQFPRVCVCVCVCVCVYVCHAHAGYKMEAQKQSKLIYQLEKEREKYSVEASEAAAKYMGALEEVKLREMAIIDLQVR